LRSYSHDYHHVFAACKVLIDELDYAIKHTDQKKTIDVGGREKRAVKYAGSETHMIELLENIWCVHVNIVTYMYMYTSCTCYIHACTLYKSCNLFSDEMNSYALSEDNGKKSYVRFNSRAGESVTLNNVQINSNTMKELKDAVRYGWMDGRTDRQMDRQMDGWMDGWTNRWMDG
jgi:hypothetical protein